MCGRPYLYLTPVLKDSLHNYLNYSTSDQLGVSIALFRAVDNGLSERPQEYVECLIKQSMWLAKNLCERTDAVHLKIPIRIGITTDLYDLAMKYLELCEFPLENVDWIESREDSLWMATEFDAMRQPAFEAVERILHLDVCHLIGSHPAQFTMPMFDNILKNWRSEPMASRDFPWADNKGGRFPWWRFVIGEKGWELYYQRLADILGEASRASEYIQSDPFPYIPGNIFGFSQSVLQSELIDKCLGIGLADEIVLSLYMFVHRSSVAVLSDIIGYGIPDMSPDIPRKLWHCPHEMDPVIWLEGNR